jgi:hypothetical protein
MNTVLTWACKILSVAWKIIAPILTNKIQQFLNDKANQLAAKEAVIAAATEGLKDNEAFDKAANTLKESLLKSGKEASQLIIDTLIQNAYLSYKCSIMDKEAKDAAVKVN